MSRKEIEDYAVRSQVLRNARRRRSRPNAERPQENVKVRLPRETYRQTPSTDSESSETDDRPPQPRRRAHRSYTPSVAGSDTKPQSGYPNPYGAPPSPVLSTTSTQRERTPRSHRDHKYESRRYDSSSDSESDRRRHHSHSRSHHKRDKDYAHGRSSTASRATSGSSHGRHREKDRKNSRWRENLTAAGLGGAAASLLGVLSEAAEGI